MEETSKTNKEIFKEKYPAKEFAKSPMACVQAIGYLKALTEYFPSEKNWTDSYIETLMIAVLFHLL